MKIEINSTKMYKKIISIFNILFFIIIIITTICILIVYTFMVQDLMTNCLCCEMNRCFLNDDRMDAIAKIIGYLSLPSIIIFWSYIYKYYKLRKKN